MSTPSAAPKPRTISPRETSLRLAGAAKPAHLIDVRSPGEFGTVHAVGARNIALDALESHLGAPGAELDKDAPVYLLCRSGRRAETAAGVFAAAGFGEVLVVEGGTDAWLAEGLPVVRGGRSVIALERQVRIGAGFLVLAGVLLGFFVAPPWFLLAGFVGAGLIFAGVTDWCGMALLLARAPWNR